MSKASENSLAARLKNPTQKIEWALKLLRDKGHRIGEKVQGEGAHMTFEINGQTKTIPEIYATVSKLPEWNDRLGLGTATLRRAK